LKTAAKVAVASSVHGRVQRRQQQRWAAQDQAAGLAGAPPVPSPAAVVPHQPAPAAVAQADPSVRLAQLTQLGELKTAGVLSEAEFEREKARILSS
jgi:hypothetical protein